ESLALLPAPGESLHLIFTARLDLADILAALLDRLGRCERMALATLGYNERNLSTMLRWLGGGLGGELLLVASRLFRRQKGARWERTQEEFRRRGQRCACCASHAKVAALRFASGERLSLEGSANCCSSGSARENLAVFNDAALHDWHAAWIRDLVDRHEGQGE